jgi:hypothetical protein
MAASPGTIFSLLITALVSAVGMINTTFWQVIVSKKLLVSDALLPLFPMFRSVIALVFFFTVIPRLTTRTTLKMPLLMGFTAYVIGQSILILTPPEPLTLMYPLLCVSLIFDGFGAGILAMLAESLVALHVNAAERARVMAIQHMIIMGVTAPFGWVSGFLSGLSRNLPFALNIALLCTGIVSSLLYYKERSGKPVNL